MKIGFLKSVSDILSTVTQGAKELLRRALALPEEERAALASSLIESLAPAVDEYCEEAWNEETARRIDELDSGKTKAVPWEEVRRRISSKLTRGH